MGRANCPTSGTATRKAIDLTPIAVGAIDRDRAVDLVLARTRVWPFGWNAADIRGEVEQFIVGEGVVVDAAMRRELAEDLTARTSWSVRAAIERRGVPEHIRALTSLHVLDVERDITSRLASVAPNPARDVDLIRSRPIGGMTGRRSGPPERRAPLGRRRSLIVVEGAAGAGKTTTLAATRDRDRAARRPTDGGDADVEGGPKAARQVGGDAASAAWLAFQHGLAMGQHGTWTRLAPGDTDPVTGRDYVGPVDRARARRRTTDHGRGWDARPGHRPRAAVLADERHMRRRCWWDRHQLPPSDAAGCSTSPPGDAPRSLPQLDAVHRFTRDIDNADGTTARGGRGLRRAQLRHARRRRSGRRVRRAARPQDRSTSIPAPLTFRPRSPRTPRLATPDGIPMVVVADTHEQVAALNAAIRDRLVAAGRVDDTRTTTGAGAADRCRRPGRRRAATTPTSMSPTVTPGPSPAVDRDGR